MIIPMNEVEWRDGGKETVSEKDGDRKQEKINKENQKKCS